MSAQKSTVLFLCSANSCRSQMAEALLRKLAGDRFDVYSAGTQPAAEIHPLTRQVMAEVDCDLAGQRPKGVEPYLGTLSPAYVIILCEQTARECPTVFPTLGPILVWPFKDPAAGTGSLEVRLAKFREVRDAINSRLRAWLEGQA
jgi:arsenate reductase